MIWTRPVEQVVSQATRAPGSLARMASSTASEIWSQILSGCPSVTDSDVNSVLDIMLPPLFFRKATCREQKCTRRNDACETLIFRFPAGIGTLRSCVGCRASQGLFPQPLLISCYSDVMTIYYHSFPAKSTIRRCTVCQICTKEDFSLTCGRGGWEKEAYKSGSRAQNPADP